MTKAQLIEKLIQQKADLIAWNEAAHFKPYIPRRRLLRVAREIILSEISARKRVR